MLHHANRLIGATIHAADGTIGRADDLLADTDRWTIRYLVVTTGEWLGRRVLISPMAVTQAWEGDAVHVTLTREQVRSSPDADPQRPLTRDQEAMLLQYYGHPVYWGGADLWGAYGFPAALMGAPPEPLAPPVLANVTAEQRDASIGSPGEAANLVSLADVTGFHIHASDGEIGHVDDFLIDETSWQVQYIRLDTSNWIGGKAVALSPRVMREIDRADRAIRVALSRDQVKASPLLTSVNLAPGELAPPFVLI